MFGDWVVKVKKLQLRIASGAVIFLLVCSQATGARLQIPIVVGAEATGIEKFAAEELATHLQRLNPDQRFASFRAKTHCSLISQGY